MNRKQIWKRLPSSLALAVTFVLGTALWHGAFAGPSQKPQPRAGGLLGNLDFFSVCHLRIDRAILAQQSCLREILVRLRARGVGQLPLLLRIVAQFEDAFGDQSRMGGFGE